MGLGRRERKGKHENMEKQVTECSGERESLWDYSLDRRRDRRGKHDNMATQKSRQGSLVR